MTDVLRLLESRRLRLGRWAGAAAVICALHIGGVALALMSWHEEEAEDAAAGAVAVDLVPPLPAAVRVASPDLAHGPEQQEAKLAPEAAKEVVEEVEKDILPVDPTPAPEPEVALPKPQPEEEKPKEEEAKEAVAEPDRPQQDHDALATAPPRVDEQPAPSPAPQPRRQPASATRAQESWKRGLIAKLNRNKHYPDAASRRGVKGVTLVRFKIDRTGQVIASEVVQSSGSASLDEEALALLKRISPVPPPPDEVTDEMLDNLLPIWFGLKPDP
jgi:protein TonB